MSTQLEALRRHVAPRTAPAPAGAAGRVVVVGGGKGGVGTSSVAALLALLAAAEGVRTLLVDADEAFSALALLLGLEPASGWAALRAGQAPRELLVPLSPTLALLPGGGAAEAPPSPAERRALFRRVAGLYPEHELVVVDGGSRLDPVLAACAAGAERLLAVTTADRIALAASYALVKAVEGRHPGLPMALLVNYADERSARQAQLEVAAATDHFLARPIDFAGAVPDDGCLKAGMAAGMSIQDAAEGSPAAAVLHQVVRRIVAAPVHDTASAA